MLLFHYVCYFARRATILLYVLVLLSTRAVNEQSEENERERKRRRKNRRKEEEQEKELFLHANTATKVSLLCNFWDKKEKKERARTRNNK
jgi:hypothetical protein